MELRTHIPRLERILLVSQLFTWNLACPGSLIVCVIFWATLVRKQNEIQKQKILLSGLSLLVRVSLADRFCCEFPCP